MKILIPTMPDDTHAFAVFLLLRQRGHHPVLWYSADYPVYQKHSFTLNDQDVTWQANGVELSWTNPDFDVVWYRRPRRPILTYPYHPDDYPKAYRENAAFFDSFWLMVESSARWVNPHWSAMQVKSKLFQLKMAQEIGFLIPPTLMSNDPVKIREFIQQDAGSEVVYKTFYPMAWKEENGLTIHYNTVVRLDDLPSAALLQQSPGIFQKKIEKAYELRVTVMGRRVIAVKIASQAHPDGKTDWRAIPTEALILEPYDLPVQMEEACIQLLERLGLVFGCFDFIVTPDQAYYFLEVNEQGQFLWIEQANEDIPMLSYFCDFLTQDHEGHSGKVQRKEKSDFLSQDFFANWVYEVESMRIHAQHLHQVTENI